MVSFICTDFFVNSNRSNTDNRESYFGSRQPIAIRLLGKGIIFCFIGGIAVLRWGVPRFDRVRYFNRFFSNPCLCKLLRQGYEVIGRESVA